MWIHEPSNSYQSFPAPAGEGWRAATSEEIEQINSGQWQMPVQVPQKVSRRQGCLALLAAGKLLEVEAAIDAIADPAQHMAAQINYQHHEWERDNPAIAAIGALVGLDSKAIDDLFIAAAQIK